MPHLWDLMIPTIIRNTETTGKNFQDNNFQEQVNQLVFSLQLLEIIVPNVAQSLLPQVIECLPYLCILLAHPYKAVRHMSSRCMAVLSYLDVDKVKKKHSFMIKNVF